MFATKNLAQNEFIELAPERFRSAVAAMATHSTTATTAVFVIQIPITPSVGGTTQWISIGIFDAINQVAVANLTGASKYGWADVPGVEKVRCTRTDGTGGIGIVGFSVVNC